MHRWIIIFTLLTISNITSAKDTIKLTDLKSWTIIIAQDAIPSEQYAANEFQELIKKAADFELPIKHEPVNPSHNIFIGYSPDMRSSSIGFDIANFSEEELRIRITQDNIIIAGGRPRGTLYGVYEFMERYLDIRFLTFDHTYIPDNPQKRIPCEEWSYEPSFTFRWSYYKENADHQEFAARLRVNTTTHDEKYGGVTRQNLISHSFNHLLPVEKYGKEHPEYFALVDGERKLEMGGGGPELCVTNPEVIEIVAQNVIKELDKNPTLKNYSVSQNDNAAYCRCDKCEAINQREGTPMGSHLAMVNAVAERVEKKHPNVKIGTLSYWYTRKPPKTIKPRHNVQIQLCSIECSTLYALDNPQSKKNRKFCDDMNVWGGMCNDIWIWHYNTNFKFYDLPFPNLRAISPNVKYFLKNNVKGIFMQANGNGNSGEMCDLRNYVISRCLWNPQLDSWKLAQEFCKLHYGKAGNTIIRYLTFLHDNAEKAGYEPTCFPLPFEMGLNAKVSDKIYRFFQQALKKVENETVRNRVEKASICAYRSVLETGGKLERDGDRLRIVFPQKYGDIVSKYTELTKKHGQTRAEEWQPIDHYFKILQQATQDGFKAETLENEIWRLALLPDDNGKVFELFHKPSKKHLLMPPEFRCLRKLFDHATHQEWGVKGYDHSAPAEFSIDKKDAELLLSKTLKDGSIITRKIALQNQFICYETQVTHKGAAAKEYQFSVRPEVNTGIFTNDSDKVGAFILDDKWIKFNKGWKGGDGPDIDLFKNATGGGYALYNYLDKYGLKISYNSEKYQQPALWWSNSYPIVLLDLTTKPAMLDTDQSYSYSYKLEFITQPPK